MNTLFYLAAAVAIISSLLVVTRAHAVHALIYLVVSLLAVSVIFFIAGAPFIAALEVIIYAGAIMVLFIFVVMMLSGGEEARKQEKMRIKPRVWILPGILSGILLVLFLSAVSREPQPAQTASYVSPKEVGISLFSKYLLGVEMAAMLLMGGIVGAYHLGKQKKKVIHRFLKEEPEDENNHPLQNQYSTQA